MESLKLTNNIHYIPTLPTTEKLFSSALAISPDGKYLGYCSSSIIIIRSLEDFTKAKVFTGHIKETSAIAFHPNQEIIASGDIEGNIKIWNINTMNIFQDKKGLGSKILGMDFVDSGKRLFIYGYGKNSVKYINWETFSADADFAGHTRNVLTADFKRVKPYKIVTGGEDMLMTFHEGPPFRFKASEKYHNNFVSCVKYNLDSTQFASTGFDKKIHIWDAETNKILYTLESTTSNMHTMSIISLVWIDNNTLVSTSIDRSTKIWDLESKQIKFTLLPAPRPTKGNLPEPHIGCTVTYSAAMKYLIMLTLDGKLNIWNYDSLENDKLPDFVIDGHQNGITHVRYSKQLESLVSLDSSGKIILWDNQNNAVCFKPSALKSNDFDLLDNGIMALSINYNGEYFLIDLKEEKIVLQGTVKGDPQRIRAINGKDNTFLILCLETLYLLENTTIIKSIPLSQRCNALDINEVSEEIYVGDSKGNILTYDYSLNLKSTENVFSVPTYYIKVSNAGKLIAVSDNNRNLYVLDSVSKQILVHNFTYHCGKIYDLSFNNDDSMLISCSLDRSTFLWNVPNKEKVSKWDLVDKEGCFSATWTGDSSFCIAGATGIISKFSI